MSFGSWLAGLFDPSGQRRANQARDDLNTTLDPGSAYWQSGQLTGDQGIVQGAADLQHANIGVDTSAVDADSDEFDKLGGQFSDIQQNGGKLTAAELHQAQADMANTATPNLKAANRQAAGNVLATDSAERNWAAGGANQSRAQVLANMLKKQSWNTAVSHANFEAAQAGQGLMNQDTNLAVGLAQGTAEGAAAARQGERSTNQAMNQISFDNAMAAAQMGISAVGSAASGIAGMASAAQSVSGAGGAAGSAVNSGYTAAPQTFSGGTGGSAGYSMTGGALGSAMNTGTSRLAAPQAKISTPEQYVNPISGSTVNANYPSDVSSWGSWLTNGSSLVT